MLPRCFCSLRPVSHETLIKQKSGRERRNISISRVPLIISNFLLHNLYTTMDSRSRRLSYNDYTVACICPMGVELAAVEGMLDEIHESLPSSRDQNGYTLGRVKTLSIRDLGIGYLLCDSSLVNTKGDVRRPPLDNWLRLTLVSPCFS
jgi:hypothetical protein